MPSAPASMSPSPAAQAWRAAQAWLAARGGLAGMAHALRTPRGVAVDELAEARELLAYWERRARRLPRWALMRRREARVMARRWRERVHEAEQHRYGRGLLGMASMYAIERRTPTSLAHRRRQAGKVVLYTAATAAMTVAVVLLAVLVAVAEIVLSVF